MAVKSPVVLLYDANGNPVSYGDGADLTAISSNERQGVLVGGRDDGTPKRWRPVRVATDGTQRVDPTGTTTQPVSAASLPLPAGAATEATLATRLTEATGAAIEAVVTAIRDTAGVKKITDQLPAGTNNIGDVDVVSLPATTQAGTLAKTADFDTDVGDNDLVALQGIALPSAAGAVIGGTSTNPVRIDPTGSTTQPVSNATATQADGHSATIGSTGDADTVNTIIGRLKKMVSLLGAGLPAVLSGAGNLKTAVVEALPAGLNRLGSVRLVDAADAALDVVQGAAATARGLLALGKDSGGLARVLRTLADGALEVVPSGLVSRFSTANSTTTPLTTDQEFNAAGTWEDASRWAEIAVAVNTSHASATAGLVIEQSDDSAGSPVLVDDDFTLPAGTKTVFVIRRVGKYVRVRYKNGATAQTTFVLKTEFFPFRAKPSTHGIESTLKGFHDAELTRTVITGKLPNGQYGNVLLDSDGHLLVVPTAPATFVQGFVRAGGGTGTESLVADGDPTAVVYVFNADSTTDIVLTQLRFLLVASAVNFNGTKFGSGSALANGIKVEVTSESVTSEVRIIKLNEDFLIMNAFLVLDLTGTTDLVTGGFLLSPVLRAGTGDKVTVTIRDDLTTPQRAISYLTCSVYGNFSVM